MSDLSSRADSLKPLWDATAGPWDGFPPLRGSERCDVAIVGGGVTGLAAALAIAQGGARVTLIEADTIGFRASGRNGGQSVIGGRGPNDDGLDRASIGRIARAAVERFPQLAGTPWAFGWSCRVAMTLDDMPHVHALGPGAWTAVGYCGRGVSLAVSLGGMLGALALGAREEKAAYPLTPLRRVPFYPLRQPGAAAAIMYYRMKDRLGLPT